MTGREPELNLLRLEKPLRKQRLVAFWREDIASAAPREQ